MNVTGMLFVLLILQPLPPTVATQPLGVSTSGSSFDLSDYAHRVEQCGVVATYAILKWFGRPASVDDVMQHAPNQQLRERV